MQPQFILPIIAALFGVGNTYAPAPHCVGHKSGKSKGGKGGSGATKKGPRTKQPAGYYSQRTPIEHMHSAARLREITRRATV